MARIRAHYMAGRAREAEEVDRRLMSEANKRAWLLATAPDRKPGDAALAVEWARLALRLRRNWGPFWTTLGVALYRAGEYAESLKSLERSMELTHGGDAIDRFFVAMAKHKLAQEGAREWYDKAVAWMEEHAFHDEDLKELKRFRAEAEELLGIKK
jgi:tetratricopeptide (TPR) repeat protein